MRQTLAFVVLSSALLAGLACRRGGAAPGAPQSPATAAPVAAPVVTSAAILSATTAPAVPAASSPAPATQPVYRYEPLGLTLSYPRGWTQRKTDDYAWLIAPAGAAEDQRSISLEIPSLPPHLPGMIPLRLVRNGYVDDLKKQYPSAAVTDPTPPTILGANARLVHSTWTDATGAPRAETALIIVRGDHVYILRADDAAAGEPATRKAFDDVVRSLKWGK